MHSPTSIRLLALCATLAASLVASAGAAAQSTDGQLAAWDALMLSPAGALPPVARQNAGDDPRRDELSVRYGFWRYDGDDSPHSNFGATVAHRFTSATEVAVTGGFLSISCGGCTGWVLGGAELRQTLWSSTRATSPLSGAFGIRASAGAAFNRGASTGSAGLAAGRATARSVSAAVDLSVGARVPHVGRLTASVLPGYGFGALSSTDLTGQGMRSTFGAALAWETRHGVSVDVGTQRIVYTGAPAQFGGGLSWRFR